jgi:phosphoadenosine phosphosulfate reductase
MPACNTSIPESPNLAVDFPALDPEAVLAHAITQAFPGRIAVVSSFGAESAVLLHMVSRIDPRVPVLFLQTNRHFPETLAYRSDLAASLDLTNVRDIMPDQDEEADQDPTGQLYAFDPDACCALRKVRPLSRALAPFDAWVTGRKRYQSATRAALPVFELAEGKMKLNPLAGWNAARVQAEMRHRNLPPHPLVSQGYPSIGCAACTRPVACGQDARSGRWSGLSKTECGIHRPIAAAPA